jgi:hypothetical protein
MLLPLKIGDYNRWLEQHPNLFFTKDCDDLVNDKDSRNDDDSASAIVLKDADEYLGPTISEASETYRKHLKYYALANCMLKKRERKSLLGYFRVMQTLLCQWNEQTLTLSGFVGYLYDTIDIKTHITKISKDSNDEEGRLENLGELLDATYR